MNNQIRQKAGRHIINPSKPTPVSKNMVKNIANSEMWRQEFNSDFEQIVKSISNAESGLRYGSPNPRAT